MQILAVRSVLGGPGSCASSLNFDVGEAFFCFRVNARKTVGACLTVTAGHHAVGHDATHGPEHGFHDLGHGLAPRRHTGRRQGIRHQTGFARHLDGTESSRIQGHVGIHDTDHGVEHAPLGAGPRTVHIAPRLTGGAVKVHLHPVPSHMHVELDLDGFIDAAVVIQVIRSGVVSFRKGRDETAHHVFAVRQQQACAFAEDGKPVFADELLHPSYPDEGRGRLSPEVFHGLFRDPNVAGNHVEDLRILPSFAIKLDKGNPQALLVDLRQPPCDTARHGPSHVELMSDVGHKGHPFSIHKNRRKKLHIQEMLASQIGIVGDDHISFAEVLDAREQIGGGRGQAEHHERAEVSLSQDAAVRVQNGAIDVHDLFHDRGSPHPHQAVSHVVGNRLQPIANHLHGHRIGLVSHHKAQILQGNDVTGNPRQGEDAPCSE